MKNIIILDIGHASGTGARGNGQEEHDLASKFGKKLKEKLREKGIKSIILDYPNKSNKEDLRLTVKAANAESSALFGVSIHLDASGNPSARGSHVCFTSSTGKVIAQQIAPRLAKVMPGRAETIKERDDLYILNNTRAPWVLVELGFISNAHDITILMDDPDTANDETAPLLEALAEGIHKAIKATKASKKS